MVKVGRPQSGKGKGIMSMEKEKEGGGVIWPFQGHR
jgi:hypothetical protein